MKRRFPWLRTSILAANLLALSYPSLSVAQTPAPPPSPGPAAPATPPAGYQPQTPPPPGAYAQPAQPGYPQQAQPGAPQQTPPPGYYPQQQPPPGYYPQQPQPGYPPPPPPGYYSQQPPPGYPPGYYPAQPGYGPAPIPMAPQGPAFRRGFLAMPYMGVHIPTGDFADGTDPGFRLGTLLGGHIGPFLSINGELAIDVLSPKNMGSDVTGVAVDVLFSPLFHFGTEAIEAFVGPKIGGFGLVLSHKTGGITETISYSGMAYGVNAGVGIPLGRLALGGMFSYTGRSPSEVCYKETGSSEDCSDYHGDDWHSVAFTGFVLF